MKPSETPFHEPDHVKETVILFYNRMFGQLQEPECADYPPGFVITEDRKYMETAAAVVFHLPQTRRFFLPAKRPGQLWVAWTMESDSNYSLQRNKSFLGKFDLKMSYHLDADVMVGYIPNSIMVEGQEVEIGPVAENLVCSFVSGSVDAAGRTDYLRELGRCLDVHSYGKRGNRVLENDSGRASKLDKLGEYKFNLAFENSIATDYVTEKFYDPLVSGCVPVYRGAPNANKFAPVNDCFIDAADFAGPRELAQHLLHLGQDDTRYTHLRNWRQRPFRPGFLQLIANKRAHPFVRLCHSVAALQAARSSPENG